MTISEVLAVISPLAAVLFAYVAMRRGQRTDEGKAEREMGSILTELGYLKSQMDGLLRKLENNEDRYAALSERITVVEQSAKSAHKRIDEYGLGRAAE
jgi:chromosome segregation ATPase